MKKFLMPLFSFVLIAALATVSFAMTRGTVVVKDEYYDDVITSALPGDTVYVGLCSVPSSSKDIPSKAYLYEAETLNENTGDDDKLFGSGASKPLPNGDKNSGGKQLTIVKKEADEGDDYYFAVLEIKDIKNFPSDGYDVIPGTIRVTRKNDDTFDVTPKLESIGYEEGDDELEEDPRSFSFDRDDDIELPFPDGGGMITGTAKKDFTLVAAMSTEEMSSITRKYPDASLNFFLGNDASLTGLRSPKLFFDASEDDYLYEINGSSTLINRTNTYDDDEGGFVVSTNTLGKYLVSDTRITSTGSSSNDDDDDDHDDDYDLPSYVSPVNPSTGAQV